MNQQARKRSAKRLLMVSVFMLTPIVLITAGLALAAS